MTKRVKALSKFCKRYEVDIYGHFMLKDKNNKVTRFLKLVAEEVLTKRLKQKQRGFKSLNVKEKLGFIYRLDIC